MKPFSSLILFIAISGLLACKDCDQCNCEPNYEYDPTNPRYVCKAPEITKNIIGSWKYETNTDSLSKTRTGYVTFDATNRVVDPDSLFENYYPGVIPRRNIAKEYRIDANLVHIDLFYNHPRDGKRYGGGWRFIVKENECNRIRLELPPPNGNAKYIALTR